MLVVDSAFDVFELDDGERDHDEHQDHGLGGRGAEVLADEAVGIDLVDQDMWSSVSGPPDVTVWMMPKVSKNA